MTIEHAAAPSDDDAAGATRPVPIRGPVLTGGLMVCAAAMLAADTLAWAGVAILAAFLIAGCTLLVLWSQ